MDGQSVAFRFSEPEAVQLFDRKLFAERFARRVFRKRPGRTGRPGPGRGRVRRDASVVFAIDHFGGADARQLVFQSGMGERTGLESAAGQFGPCDTDLLLSLVGRFSIVSQVDRRDIVGFAWVQQTVVGQCPGADHASDFALDQSLGGLGVFDLFANRRPITRLESACVDKRRADGGETPPSRSGCRCLCRDWSASDPRIRSRLFGVIKKQFVEVAHAEETAARRHTPPSPHGIAASSESCGKSYRSSNRSARTVAAKWSAANRSIGPGTHDPDV